MTNLEKMDEWYNLLREAKTSADRAKYYKKMVALYKVDKTLRNRWEFHPSAKLFIQRFRKRLISVSEMAKKKGFDDGIDYNVPACDGLYLIGETHFNPHTDEKFYWVKVGKATNLAERFRQYNTCNPMLFRIDFNTNGYNKEKFYHAKLAAICINKCNHNSEWFLVDRDTYLNICEKGFSYFA